MEDRKQHLTKGEKTVKMTMLLDFYSALLSEGQREALEYFYGEDLSLAEISQLTGITRQGVRDRIVKGERVLSDTEERLGLVARFSDQRDILAGAVQRLEALRPLCGESSGQIDEIIRMIEELL